MADTNTNSAGNTFSLSEAHQYLEFWREFDLDGRRLSLDKTCAEMKDMKSASIAARKRLNETTKTFRAKSKDEQVVAVGDVLHEYQGEIDQLAKRAKYSENAFYGLYKALYEAPDPCYVLEHLLALITSTSTHQLEIERLRAEISQYEEEFQQLKNQDITIRRLEEQLQEFKDKISEKVAEEVHHKSVEANEAAEARIADMRDAQRASERRLAAALESLRQAQAEADRAQSQVFEISSQAEARASALRAENALLAEAAHRNSSRIAELEQQLANLPSRGDRDKDRDREKDDTQSQNIEDKALTQLLLSDLRAECQKKDEMLRLERQKFDSSLRDATSQLNKEREAISSLRQELADRPNKEEHISLKRHFKTLQRIVFNLQDDDGEGAMTTDDINPESTDFVADKVQFEVLLAAKLKALEGELSDTRRQLMECREQERIAKSLAASLKTSLEASTSLVQRLEADLEVRTSKSKPVSNRDVRMSDKIHSDPTNGLAELLEDGFAKPTGSIQKEGQQQLVTILQAQRDRYKDRLAQVESSIQMMQQQVDSLTATKAQLEADNLSLYGKIRFLQSYTNPSQVSRPVKSMRLKNAPQNHAFEEEFGFGSADDQRDVERKYQGLYEQGISPFAEFSQFERQRKLNELSVADRIVLNTTMAFVSSHYGRSFLLIYLALMHILVFSTLYYSAHHVHYGCDPAIDHLIHKHQQDLANTATSTATAVVAAMRHMRQ